MNYKATLQFLECCRKEIVQRKLDHITPKIYLLESHTVPSIRKLRVGWGLLAEQGSERIHVRFNTLHWNFNSIPNQLKRLKAIANQHIGNTLPQNTALCAKITGRK